MDVASEVYDAVLKGISELDSLPNRSELAGKLRRCSGIPLEEAPEVWDLIMSMNVRTSAPSCRDWVRRSDRAVYLALTAYAVHSQRGWRNVPNTGVSFGTAVRKLFSSCQNESVRTKFEHILRSQTLEESVPYFRSLVQMMGGQQPAVGLDYPMFAKDLFYIQYPSARYNVMWAWGKDFYQSRREYCKPEE